MPPTPPHRRAIGAFTLVTLLSGCQRYAPLPVLGGLRGSEGALLWVDEPLPEGGWIERRAGGGWVRLDGRGPWWDPEAEDGFAYRLASDRVQGEAFVPGSVELSLTSPQAERMLFEGDTADLEADWTLPGEREGLSFALARTRGSAVAWLDGACLAASQDTGGDPGALDACWTETESTTFSTELAAPVSLPAISTGGGDPARVTWTLGAVMQRDGGSWTIAQAPVSVVDLGRRLVWGDTHAHSGLSMDGCEVYEEGCSDRTGWPAGDFFAQAAASGLDFVALTDHAEWVTLYSYALDEQPIDIWQASLDTVAAAAGGEVLPILGAEWTYAAENVDAEGHRWGGHKTMLFADLDACAEYRVAFRWPRTIYERESGWSEGPNPVIADTPDTFWARLAEAGVACGPMDVITYFHHGALSRPQPVDWTWPAVAPDDRYENLVEVYSEHGLSECLDPEADGCSWHIPPDVEYYPRGSLQQALSMGYRLGIVAGTDSHDARPGSLDDGPSCAAGHSEGSCQTYPGGLVGVMIAGALDRPTLFAAMHARHTWATSGPREPIAAAVIGADDAVYLPGDVLPSGGGPWRLRVEVPEELDLTRLQVVSADGSILLATEGHAVAEDIDPGSPFYLRFRLDDDQHRVWASPFFPEP